MTSALLDHLDRHQIPYAHQNDRLVVLSGLVISWPDTEIANLPPNLTVRGSLDMRCTQTTHLPEGLVVEDDFVFDAARCTFPTTLTVGGDLMLRRSKITALPAVLTVGGSLRLKNSTLPALPEGLSVGRTLDLLYTPITRLPKAMQVGGLIVPPPRLRDLEAFMEGTTGEVRLHKQGSQHERLETHARLRAYPDLYRVFLSMPPQEQLVIWWDRDIYRTQCIKGPR